MRKRQIVVITPKNAYAVHPKHEQTCTETVRRLKSPNETFRANCIWKIVRMCQMCKRRHSTHKKAEKSARTHAVKNGRK